MAKSTLTFSVEWIEESGDCSKCCGCEEMIFGKMFTLHVVCKETDKVDSATETKLCNSCFDCLEK